MWERTGTDSYRGREPIVKEEEELVPVRKSQAPEAFPEQKNDEQSI